MTTRELRKQCKSIEIKASKLRFIKMLHDYTYSKNKYKALTLRPCKDYADKYYVYMQVIDVDKLLTRLELK